MPRPMNLAIAVGTGEQQTGVTPEESLAILHLEVVERDPEYS